MFCSTATAESTPAAIRSGTTLPSDRIVAIALEGAGIYVPSSAGVAPTRTWMAEGGLVWNLAFIPRLGLFAKHTLSGLKWDTVTMVAMGHEVGLRILAADHYTVEAAYLSHRNEDQWVETDDGGNSQFSVGGVRDRGIELSNWWRFDPHYRLRLETQLVTRIFSVYQDTQGVIGLGLRISLNPTPNQQVITEIKVLRIVRHRPRPGVDRITWNTVGTGIWRLKTTERLGLMLGVRATTSMFCGQVPMFELVRSMIDEKTVFVLVGVDFFV